MSMRVDFVTKEFPPQIYGGAGVHVTELVSALADLVDTRVHAFGPDRDQVGVRSYQTPKSFSEANPALQTLATDLEMVPAIQGADIVHSHTWYANFAGQVASMLYATPHVITAHSLEPLRPWKKEQLGGGYEVSSFIEKSAYLQASRIIAVSSGMRDDILASYPELDPAKVTVVHNGVDSDKWSPTNDPQVLKEFGIDPSRRSIIFVGRITRQKGLTYFLQAVRELPEDVQIILAAGAPDTPELLAEVEALVDTLMNRRTGVIWIAEHLPQHKLAALLTFADLFACPSIYEPLGIVNLEAMACGTAVVATQTGGIPEVVAHGSTGWLVPIDQVKDGSGTPNNPGEFISHWAETMNLALKSGSLEEFGQAGRQRAVDEFSWKTIATRTLEVYQSALSS